MKTRNELLMEIAKIPFEKLTRGILDAENTLQSKQVSESELIQIQNLIEFITGETHEIRK